MQVSDSDGSGSGSVLILDLVVHKERREGTYSMIKLRQRSLIKCGVYGGGRRRRRRLGGAVEVGLG